MSEQTVLFVDDEPNILKTLQRVFFDEDYQVLTAGSGAEALALIEQGKRPAVIVSDQRMPGMSGAEFLARARQQLPDSIRIMLTGYADISAAVDAINLGGVFRYILKPWDDADLKMVIREAFDRYRLIEENNRLNIEIKEANRQLEELNRGLERKVEERTRDLRKAYEDNLELNRVLRKKVLELEGWDRIQRHLLTIHPIEETMEVFLDVSLEVAGADAASFFLINDNDAGGLKMAARKSAKENAAGGAFSEQGESLLAPIRASVLAGGAARLLLREEAERIDPGIFCLAMIPVVKGDRRYGLFEVVVCSGGESIDGEKLHTLSNFGLQAAIAIQDSRLDAILPDLESSLDEVLASLKV